MRYYASTWAAQKFPQVKELQSLEAVRKRLHSIWGRAQLGGEKAAKRLLALGNAALRKKHPKATPLTLDDLNWVHRRDDGTRRVQFIRWQSKDSVSAYLTIPKKGPPTVEVYAK